MPRRRPAPDRAKPDRQDADLGVQEREELRGAVDRDVDVLDHRFGDARRAIRLSARVSPQRLFQRMMRW